MSRFRGLKCPTVLRDFPVQNVVTERVPKVQIYLHNKTIASEQLYSQITKNIFTHLKNWHQKHAHPVRRTTTQAFPSLMNVLTPHRLSKGRGFFNQIFF